MEWETYSRYLPVITSPHQGSVCFTSYPASQRLTVVPDLLASSKQITKHSQLTARLKLNPKSILTAVISSSNGGHKT